MLNCFKSLLPSPALGLFIDNLYQWFLLAHPQQLINGSCVFEEMMTETEL